MYSKTNALACAFHPPKFPLICDFDAPHSQRLRRSNTASDPAAKRSPQNPHFPRFRQLNTGNAS